MTFMQRRYANDPLMEKSLGACCESWAHSAAWSVYHQSCWGVNVFEDKALYIFPLPVQFDIPIITYWLTKHPGGLNWLWLWAGVNWKYESAVYLNPSGTPTAVLCILVLLQRKTKGHSQGSQTPRGGCSHSLKTSQNPQLFNVTFLFSLVYKRRKWK